ncbi:MAG: glutamate--tRNA ligase [Gemmatimonadales bacterium]|nr:glutamate--tRNA ligase [Gemmatimonadales bacterium]
MSHAPVRVRFAPSPTGYLHVGGARTALFNWLFARKTGGTFVLRIEDTDRERSTDAHTRVILDGLGWLGITWDEGPFFQGAYGDRHRADAERLLATGRAYRCFYTKEEMDAERERATAENRVARFDRYADLPVAEAEARAARGEPHTIRFRVPDEEIAWLDAVHGRISFHGRDMEDFIVLRSDGSAIYNMAVVSDDIAMRITHVIRGDDHVSNTPKQIALYRALGHEPPVFAHVPMILGDDGKKLSKRHGATAVGDYQAQGIFPLAMRNFLALLGWSPGGDREIIPDAELVGLFSLDGIQSKPAVFDLRKLEWMNGQYLSLTPSAELEPELRRLLDGMGVATAGRALGPVIDAAKVRSRTLTHLAEQVAVRLDPARARLDDKGAALVARLGDRFLANLALVREALAALPADGWTPDAILAAITAAATAQGVKLGDAMQPVRVALTGGTVSEPVNELLAVVGRAVALERLAAGVPPRAEATPAPVA